MTYFYWVTGVLFFLLSLTICIGQFVFVFGWLVRGKRSSLIPFIGGTVGAVGLLLVPVSSLHQWWWVPLFADLGTVPLALATLIDQTVRHYRNWKSPSQ